MVPISHNDETEKLEQELEQTKEIIYKFAIIS
jgi:hypothetical protein